MMKAIPESITAVEMNATYIILSRKVYIRIGASTRKVGSLPQRTRGSGRGRKFAFLVRECKDLYLMKRLWWSTNTYARKTWYHKTK